jgi:hypothetical protein
MKPDKVMANGSLPASFVTPLPRRGGVCSPLVAFFSALFFEVTPSERCQLPTVWRVVSAKFCVLRSLRRSAAGATIECPRG